MKQSNIKTVWRGHTQILHHYQGVGRFGCGHQQGGLRNQHFWPRHSPEWSQRATDYRDASGNLNHHLPLKHSRPFYISVFSWQYVRSFCLHLCGLKFSFSPASFTGSSCLLLKTCTSWLCCLITKAFKWLNNLKSLQEIKCAHHQISRVLLAANLQ